MLFLLFTFALTVLLSSVSGEVTPVPIKSYVNSFGGYHFTGAGNSAAGTSVSMIGDYNQDGKQDFAIASPSMTVSSKAECGMVLIVLGNMTTVSEIDLSTAASGLTMRRIIGAAAGDKAGTSLGPAGDVNKDGFDDILIGAPFADPSSRANAGAIYVIFGMASTTAYADIVLSSFTAGATRGFTIFGPAAGSMLGEGKLAMRPLGDMNGDSVDDFLISAPSLTYSSRLNAGGVWMLYGKTTAPANVDLNSLGTGGILFGGSSAGENFGNAMDCAGDFNGDGINDIIIGAVKYTGKGHAYLVHGSTSLASQSMSAFVTGNAGHRYFAGADDDDLGYSVCGAGDINGDGRDDILISAPAADLNQYFPDAGEIYVVFGTATSRMSNVFLANAMGATVGYTIAGMYIGGYAGIALSRAGDLNHDGFNDYFVAENSAVYIIFGNTVTPSPFLTLKIYEGEIAAFDSVAPSSLCGGFDISGDNNPDIIVGSPTFATSGGSVSGAAYLVEGPIYPFTKPPTSAPTTVAPSRPTVRPTRIPTFQPSRLPSGPPTFRPTRMPSIKPTAPTVDPTHSPSRYPSPDPTHGESAGPTVDPTANPSDILSAPIIDPTLAPTLSPSADPTARQSAGPSADPTATPSVIQNAPTIDPTLNPSAVPTAGQSAGPTVDPTPGPSANPSFHPSAYPSLIPTASQSAEPSANPSVGPSLHPSVAPVVAPTVSPSVGQTRAPSASPTLSPTFAPSVAPTVAATRAPSALQPVSTPDVILAVEQTVLNLSEAGYNNQKVQCNHTIQHTVSDLLNIGIPERVTDIVVEEEEEEDSGRVKNVRVRATAASSVVLKYTVTAKDPLMSAATLSVMLKEKVQSGQMDNTFRSYALRFNVSGLGNCTFAEPKITHMNPVDNDESDALNVGLIVGVTVGGVIFLLLVGVCVAYCVRTRKSSATVAAYS